MNLTNQLRKGTALPNLKKIYGAKSWYKNRKAWEKMFDLTYNQINENENNFSFLSCTLTGEQSCYIHQNLEHCTHLTEQ